MKFDASLFINDLKSSAELARAVEAIGFDALWVSEAAHNPYMALALAAQATTRLKLGTAITVAFARSPTLSAYEAWDMAGLSDGRFMLGLGTQIKAHITRRFGMTWDKPATQMREYLEVLRAVWQTFQTNERLNYRGKYYKITYMTPFFQPEPLPKPHIPVFLAAVGPAMTRLAGELCEGMHVHAFTSPRYMREVTIPKVEEGLARAGRSWEDFSFNGGVFVASNEEEKILAKSQIAFYASTPAYRGVLELHGWGDLQERLQKLTRQGKWDDMHREISDEMLETIGVVADAAELGAAVREKYEGLLDRVGFYLPFVPGERDKFWKQAIGAFHD